MKGLRTAVLVLLATAALPTLPVRAATLQNFRITTADGPREYILAAPAGATRPLPLVLVLHGHIGTAANAFGEGRAPSPLSAWLAIADREPVIVAALQGLKGPDKRTGWHDCRLDAIEDPTVDDVAFAQRVVQSLVGSGRADPHRVYVMGMSNGGMMAYRLALEMHPTPAAIATVGASMAARSGCRENNPPRVSVLMINGIEDPIVPYRGGLVGLRNDRTSTVIGADQTRNFWLRTDGLSSTPAFSTTLPHLADSDPTLAMKEVYGKPGGYQVETISIQNGGHVEPSLLYHYGWLYSRLVGTQNRDFESAEEAWAFLKDKIGSEDH